MAMPVKILAFAGSLRRESYNKKLVRVAAAGARAAGADVTELDLRDLPLPIFDEDLEASEGLPANGRRLKDLMLAHHGLSHFRGGVQQFHHGRAEKRHRLGLASRGRRAGVGLLRWQGRVAYGGFAGCAGRSARPRYGAIHTWETSALL